MGNFIKAIKFDSLQETGRRCITVNNWPILIIKTPSEIFALMNMCTHQNSPLLEGRVKRGAIMCPLHGARFLLKNGENVGGQYPPVRTFETRVENGWLEVDIPREAYSENIASATGF